MSKTVIFQSEDTVDTEKLEELRKLKFIFFKKNIKKTNVSIQQGIVNN